MAHGLAAAGVMAVVQAVLRPHPAEIYGSASLLSHSNDQLCDKRIGGFLTAFLRAYNPLVAAANVPLWEWDQSETFADGTVQLQAGDMGLSPMASPKCAAEEPNGSIPAA